ncbi:M3 family metallopeptidase [Gordonia neofelifaecis]|uniref:Peptidyl-dipeptidase Dcp n=1 Tax=Gordonia neofelifaecis NRRL B-59395 TaxID=644548 RepID=F1YDT2_9ACTN|nr:M3 family metallopeptidase [Gordonia neofelifaecis]EGD57022.1 peptidyl-dipeptidase Dcp [Gordonia neofelifaecis NRRL B-59395]
MAAAPSPVLADSGLPYGLPDFASISDDDFLPAYDIAIAEHRAEVTAIASSDDVPTFDNTIAALEASGRALARVNGIFFNLEGPDSNPQRAQIAQELAVRLTEHANAITMDPALFGRIRELYERRSELGLNEAQTRLLEQRYRDAVRAGAALDEAGQDQMREISGRLATLTTEFGQQLLDDTNDSAVHFADAAELDGLSASEIAAAGRAAAEAGRDGYLVALELPTSQAAVAKLTRAESRRRVFDASTARCARGNEHDTREMILEIVTLRARRAELLGYADHAAYVIAEETAPTPQAVADLLADLGAAAQQAADAELSRLTDFAGHELTASDVTFYLAADQRARSAADDAAASVDIDEFAEYCELNAVIDDGVFAAAGRLYGLSFAERTDLAGYHPDVRVWEVSRDGVGIGLFLGDYFARPSKRGGAWMNNIVDQSRQSGTAPIVVNVLNLTRPEPGEPCLLSHDQLITLFHEFGHAIHGLLSAVDYVSQSGTSVPRDFVEFPSQVNEMWALHPDVVGGYARHHRTGEPAPPELLDAVRAAGGTESAHATVEYLAAAALDLAWHRLTEHDLPADVLDFERSALRSAGLDSELIPPRYRSTYFNHVFAGGYSSAYYSYIWSEILDAETEQWFLAGGGLRPELGAAFADAVLRRGDSVDPVAAHAAMIGHPARIEPLLIRRGLS